MLAKPEYSSPPDEVCGWQGAVTESHLEDAVGRGAVAERMVGSAMAKRMAALWQRVIGKILLAGAPWQSSIGKQLRAWPQRHDDIKKESDR